MGSCFSQYSEQSPLKARVIRLDGSLSEYPIKLTVSQVLQLESTDHSCFLSNSDNLYYDEFITPLSPSEELQLGQIYFVLSSDRLQSRLTAPDMIALALKASKAIDENLERSRKSFRVSPTLQVSQLYNEEIHNGFMIFDQNGWGSVSKLEQKELKQTKMRVRSPRLRLSTIHECSIAE
ncbi:hypothetical protein ACHQM5_015776 [Ranunculus cassubicifolius]